MNAILDELLKEPVPQTPGAVPQVKEFPLGLFADLLPGGPVISQLQGHNLYTSAPFPQSGMLLSDGKKRPTTVLAKGR